MNLEAQETLAETFDVLGTADARALLVISTPGGSEVRAIAEGESVTVGRSSEATIVVDDARVSRLHSRIRRERGAIVVEDLGSRNGTRINDTVLHGREEEAHPGDAVRIGPVELVVAQAARPRTLERSDPDDRAPEGIVVADPAMVRIFQIARRLALTPTTVLILGETGVGKEVVAEQIHRWSPRSKAAFVRLNCASLPESLLESELFGHEKGAFTGAEQKKIGYLEAAHEGTLFLDEVGEMTPATQVKLLSVLENRRVTRLGGTNESSVDVRFVCATNRALKAEVEAGRFREDLFYRINTFTLEIPPLRSRPAEVTLLAELFARRFMERAGIAFVRIEPDALRQLAKHRWPGNIRELRNAMEHAAVLADRGRIAAEHLPSSVRPEDPAEANTLEGPELRGQLQALEKKALEDALAAEGGNQTRAAKRLGIPRRTFIYKLEKYGLK